jgi:hypothetical protein
VRAAPVGLNNAAFGAARGRRALEHSVPGVGESAIFGGFKPFVFERFHGADAIRVALRGDLCGFHVLDWASIARASLDCHPRDGRGIHAVASMKCRFPVPCTGIWIERTPEREPAHARQSEHGVPARSLAHSVSTVW